MQSARRPFSFCLSCTRPSLRFASTSAVTLDDPIFGAAQKIINKPLPQFEKPAVLNSLKNLVDKIQKTHQTLQSLHAMKETETDPEMQSLANIDIEEAQEQLSLLSSEMKEIIIPPDSHDAAGALVEVKAGVGGSEGSVFAGDLVRMYTRFSERQGWKASLVESIVMPIGRSLGAGRMPYRQALLEITGTGAYGVLKHESGVHRVQRVPVTETAGRIHTSTAGVIVFPLVTDATDDKDLFDMKDIKLEVMRSRGAGGQHVNKTESAVRLTHIPTGITVSMQDSRSQHQNRTKAFIVLRGRLLDHQMLAQQEERRKSRKAQVKTSDRGEKIRTYNYPQDRVTDHRVPTEVKGLEDVMEGGSKLDVFAPALQAKDEQERLEALLEELKSQAGS